MTQHPRPTTKLGRQGVAAVELAIVLPLIMFLLLAATDFARVFYYSITITNCARNGAIHGCDPVVASQSPFTSVQDAALADAANLNGNATVTSKTVSDESGDYIEVTVNYTFQTISNYPGIPNSIPLSRTVRMRSVSTVPKF